MKAPAAVVTKPAPVAPPKVALDLTPPKPLGTWEVGPEPPWFNDQPFTLRESPVLPGLIERPRQLPGVKRWNVDTALSRGFINVARYSPDGKWLATGSSDGHVRIYDAETMHLHRLLPGRAFQHGVADLSWHPDSDRLAIAAENASAFRIYSRAGTLLYEELGGANSASSVAWSADGQWIASGGGEDLRLRDADGTVVMTLIEGPYTGCRPGSLAWSPDQKQLACMHNDGKVRLWDIATGKTTALGEVPDTFPGYRLAWGSRDWIAVSDGQNLRLYDPDRKLAQTVPYTGIAVAWHPDGQRVFFFGHNVVKAWDCTRQAFVGVSAAASSGGNRGLPVVLSCSPDGERVVMGAGLLRVWTADLTEVAWESPASLGTVTDLAWSPDGQTLASACRLTLGGDTRLWSPTGKNIGIIAEQKPVSDIGKVAWKPDGQTLLGVGDQTGVWLSAQSAPWRRVLPVGSYSAAWSADGQQIAVGTHMGKVVILDGSGTVETEMTAGSGRVRLAWSRATNLLVVHCGQQLQVCDPQAGWTLKPWAESTANSNDPTSPVWRPDGERLAICNDGWYSRDGKRIADTSRPYPFDWRADGKQYVSYENVELRILMAGGTAIKKRRLDGAGLVRAIRWHPQGHLVLPERTKA